MKFLPAISLACLCFGCSGRYAEDCPIERQFTLGAAQREICEGMSQGDVAEALGSPNIVTKDSAGKETWIYDKIATDVRQSSRASGVFLLFLNGCREDNRYNSSQKTLTIVIKFDGNRVETVSYHASKF
jgi:outer membrane protein assembly factor BamE (lipoprotein component of BamABCDE complex)